MESSSGGRCGVIAGDISIILVTAVQLIFFTRYHEYIAWYTRESDGSVARLSLLTDDYFTWLIFPTLASVVVVLASIVMIFFDRYWFRQTAWIIFPILGISVVLSLVTIFPFDFSVIPNSSAADFVPKAVRAFFIFMAVFYGAAALASSVRTIKTLRSQSETR